MVQKHTSTQKICSCPFSLHHIFYLVLGPTHESLDKFKTFYLHSGLQAPVKAATYSFPPPSSADKSAHTCLNKKWRGRREKNKPHHPIQHPQSLYECIQKNWKGIYCIFFHYRSATGAPIKIVRFPKQILFLMKCSPAIILYTQVTVLHYIVLQGPRNMKLFS